MNEQGADADTSYDAEFYKAHRDGSFRSARTIVPRVLAEFPVRSVVDIGCGVGTWLRVFADCGVQEVAGYDGDYVDRSLLMIEPDKFHPTDLRQEFSLPRRFDLAVSLEVAEHLPEERASGFVRLLTEAAPIVLFSAAIPGQGGTDHQNEQWHDYWRALFGGHGYKPADIVRPAVRGNEDVEYWYQQNMVVYCSRETLNERPDLATVPDEVSLNLVSQSHYEQVRPGLRRSVQMLPGLLVKAVSRRLHP